MADAPKPTDQPAVPAAPAPTPAPAPKPDPTPAQPKPQPAEPPPIGPDEVIEVTTPDGQRQMVRVSDAVKSYMTYGNLGGDELAKFQKFNAAMKGDQAAMMELLGLNGKSPDSHPAEPANPDDTMAAAINKIRQENEELRRMVQPAVQQAQNAREQAERSEIEAILKQHADKVPYAAKAIKMAPDMVRSAELRNLQFLAGQRGGLDKLDQNDFMRARAEAIKATDAFCRGLHAEYNGWTPQAQAAAQAAADKAARPPEIVDDQTRTPDNDILPPVIDFDGVGMVQTAMAPRPTVNPPQNAPGLPTSMTDPIAGGVMAPAPTNPPTMGMTRQQMLDRMKAKGL